MVHRWSVPLLALAFFVATMISPLGQATCPKDIHDCGVSTPLPSYADDGGGLSLAAGNYTLAAAIEGNTAAAASVVSAQGSIQRVLFMEVSAISTSSQPAHIVIDFTGATGISWTKNADGASPGSRFAFHLDPSTGLRPQGEFAFAPDSSKSIIFPIKFTVTNDDGSMYESAGVLTWSGMTSQASATANWALPGIVGLAVGVLLSAVVMRRRR